MKSFYPILVAGALAVLVASAALAAASGPVPSRLAGSYVTRFPSSQHHVPAGKWKLVLRGTKATFHNPVSPRAIFSDPVSVSGSKITFAPTADCVDDTGHGGLTKGVYHWSVSGTKLTFTRLNKDKCLNRAYVLTTHPWSRVK